jgi:hypothetical protein
MINDRFLFKYYHETSLGLPFSFVKDKILDKFYFFCLPELTKYIWDINSHYTEENDSIYSLIEDAHPVKLKVGLLDEFFKNEAFSVDLNDKKSFRKKKELANHIMEETLKFMVPNEVAIDQFKDEFKSRVDSKLLSASAFEEIAKIIDPTFERANYDSRCFNIDGVGHLIITYSLNKDDSKIKVDFYFMPQTKRRYPAGRGTTKYTLCWQ